MCLEIGQSPIAQGLHLRPGEGQTLGGTGGVPNGQDRAGGHATGGILSKGGSAQSDVPADSPASHGKAQTERKAADCGQQAQSQPAQSDPSHGHAAQGQQPQGSGTNGEKAGGKPAHRHHTGGEVADGDDPLGALKAGTQPAAKLPMAMIPLAR